MRARDIFLALLVIGVGVFLTYEKSGRLDGLFGEGWEGPWWRTSTTFDYEETQEIPGPVPAELQVVNGRGEIEIVGGDTDKVTVVFKKHVSARDQAEADQIAAELRMIVTPSESRLVLSTNRDNFRKKRFATDFKIVLPAGKDVLVKNAYGLVRTGQTGRTEITNPHGDVVVRSVEGSLILKNSYQSVDVDGVRGDARVQASHAETTLKNILGELTLDHSYGEIRLENISRKLILNGSHSGIQAKGLRAEAEISSSYETIILSDVSAVRVQAHHCDIQGDGITGLFDVTNTYGRVKFTALKGDLKVEGGNVSVDGRGLQSSEIYIHTTYQNVFLAEFSGKATVVLSHGDLNLEPIGPLTGGIDVQGTYAGVRIAWPAGLRVPFEGRARDGRIVWNLDERPDLETSNGSTETRAFSKETGKPGLLIVTTHGDIKVEPAARR
jgi:hypothetical protein